MKKLNLTPSTFQKGDVLTRSQLKKVLGGDGYGGNGGSGGGGGGGNPNPQIPSRCSVVVTHANGGGADYSSNMPPFPVTNSSDAAAWCSYYMSYHPGTTCSYQCV